VRHVGMVADRDRAGTGERGMAGNVHEVTDREGAANRDDAERVDPHVRADTDPLAARQHAARVDSHVVTNRREPEADEFRTREVFLVPHGP
jgi:hypothetical protein